MRNLTHKMPKSSTECNCCAKFWDKIFYFLVFLFLFNQFKNCPNSPPPPQTHTHTHTHTHSHCDQNFCSLSLCELTIECLTLIMDVAASYDVGKIHFKSQVPLKRCKEYQLHMGELNMGEEKTFLFLVFMEK